MQKLCFAQKRSCFPFGLPRYLNRITAPPSPATTTTTSLHYTPIYIAIFLFLSSLRPDASDTFRTYILRILLLMSICFLPRCIT